jgi:hypothetical protein
MNAKTGRAIAIFDGADARTDACHQIQLPRPFPEKQTNRAFASKTLAALIAKRAAARIF